MFDRQTDWWLDSGSQTSCTYARRGERKKSRVEATFMSLCQSCVGRLCLAIITCHFGKNTLFYNSRQHLSVRVLKFLVAVAVTKSLYRREPRETFKVASSVLQAQTFIHTTNTASHRKWRCQCVDTTWILPTLSGFHASSWCLMIGFNNFGKHSEM